MSEIIDEYLLPLYQRSWMDTCSPYVRDHGRISLFPYVRDHGRISASLISEIKNGYLLPLCQRSWMDICLPFIRDHGRKPASPYQISWMYTWFPLVRVSPARSIEINLHLLSTVDQTNIKAQDSSPYIQPMLNRLSLRKHNFYTFSSIKVNINLSLEQL